MKKMKKLVITMAAFFVMLFSFNGGAYAVDFSQVFELVKPDQITEVTKEQTLSNGEAMRYCYFQSAKAQSYRVEMSQWPEQLILNQFGGDTWGMDIHIAEDGKIYAITPVLDPEKLYKISIINHDVTFSLVINEANPSFDEMQLNEVKKGTVSTGAQKTYCCYMDKYKIVIPEDGTYVLKSQSDHSGTTISTVALYDSNLYEISGKKNKDLAAGQNTGEFTLKAGTYYAGVSVFGMNTNVSVGYELSMSKKDSYITKLTNIRVAELTVGYGRDIYYTVEPAGTLDAPTFTSSNPSVAKIQGSTCIVGVSAGTAEIVARNGKGDIIATFTVNVVDPNKKQEEQKPVPTPNPTLTQSAVKVAGMRITGETTTIAYGKSTQLKAKISPSNATNQAVTWSCNNTKYAKVSANGKVTAKKAGKGKNVVITARTADGSNIVASYKLKIAKNPVKSVKISGKKTVKAGKTLSLKAKVTAGSGANKKVVWSSSNTKYATVSANGKVKALKAGKKKTVKITARAVDGSGKKATVKIKIQ